MTHRVGPAGDLAADGAFGVALTTLWHRVASTGEGALGFVPPVERAAVAARAAVLVDDLKRGRTFGVAETDGLRLVGFAAIEPGRSVMAHTGGLSRVMVDPDHQGRGLGRALVTAAFAVAAQLGLERLQAGVRGGTGLEAFYAGFGFVEVGRLPGWIRVAAGDDRDQVILAASVPSGTVLAPPA